MQYWYIHKADGRDFGPVDEATIQLWLRERRVDWNDVVFRTGWPGWRAPHEVWPQYVAPGDDVAEGAESAGRGRRGLSIGNGAAFGAALCVVVLLVGAAVWWAASTKRGNGVVDETTPIAVVPPRPQPQPVARSAPPRPTPTGTPTDSLGDALARSFGAPATPPATTTSPPTTTSPTVAPSPAVTGEPQLPVDYKFRTLLTTAQGEVSLNDYLRSINPTILMSNGKKGLGIVLTLVAGADTLKGLDGDGLTIGQKGVFTGQYLWKPEPAACYRDNKLLGIWDPTLGKLRTAAAGEAPATLPDNETPKVTPTAPPLQRGSKYSLGAASVTVVDVRESDTTPVLKRAAPANHRYVIVDLRLENDQKLNSGDVAVESAAGKQFGPSGMYGESNLGRFEAAGMFSGGGVGTEMKLFFELPVGESAARLALKRH